MKAYELKVVEVGSLKFCVREGTSDIKTVKEVVGRNAYRKKGFELGGSSWIDLGANIGAFTCLAASLGCEVKAYEPDPVCFSLLERNVKLNGLQGKVELVNAAVVAEPGVSSVTLHLNSKNGNFWRNSLVKKWRGGEDVVVEAVHLSALPTGRDCKMDVEGSEMAMLEADFPAWKRLVFEWSFDVDASIPRFRAVIERLRARYPEVRYSKFDESQARWGASWFPPCRTVWCY